jgi:hypothetical protein
MCCALLLIAHKREGLLKMRSRIDYALGIVEDRKVNCMEVIQGLLQEHTYTNLKLITLCCCRILVSQRNQSMILPVT